MLSVVEFCDALNFYQNFSFICISDVSVLRVAFGLAVASYQPFFQFAAVQLRYTFDILATGL